MPLPPVPPRPQFTQTQTPSQQLGGVQPTQFSPPHFEDPLAAPRPHRVDPSLSANEGSRFTYGDGIVRSRWTWALVAESAAVGLVLGRLGQIARDLDTTMQQQQQPTPGFIQPNPNQLAPGGGCPPQPSRRASGVRGRASLPRAHPVRCRLRGSLVHRDGSLTVPLPAIAALTAALPTITSPSHDPALQLAWARDVLFLVDRTPSLSTSPLALAAVPLILQLAGTTPPLPEAVYLRATFAASGTYPALCPPHPRAAFRDFEAAALSIGCQRDPARPSTTPPTRSTASTAARDPAALHRLGTVHLLDQLGVQVDPHKALGFLSGAAVSATVQCPQPAYVFALILLGGSPWYSTVDSDFEWREFLADKHYLRHEFPISEQLNKLLRRCFHPTAAKHPSLLKLRKEFAKMEQLFRVVHHPISEAINTAAPLLVVCPALENSAPSSPGPSFDFNTSNHPSPTSSNVTSISHPTRLSVPDGIEHAGEPSCTVSPTPGKATRNPLRRLFRWMKSSQRRAPRT
ncbi:hypothetical protein K438DRAFT_1971315 [Mycena galopus ATCC 62051]|nr:hypothetical protein K438DRAFT_1971315 [Mycena galopus ATCC 62051]